MDGQIILDERAEEAVKIAVKRGLVQAFDQKLWVVTKAGRAHMRQNGLADQAALLDDMLGPVVEQLPLC